jgi:hypothetical protein
MKKLLIICLLLAGCSAVKKVLKDPAKIEIVGREWEKKNPCVNDSFVTFLSDTLIKFDTTYKFKTDTFNQSLIDSIFINKTIKIRDTFKVFVNDNRRLNIALDSINHYKGLAAYYNAQFEQQCKETKEQKQLKNKWMWKFWLLLLFMICLFALYLRFNNSI